MKHILFARSLAVLITFFMGLSIVNAQDNTDTSNDMLLYINVDNVLMLYDPQTRTETELLQNVASPIAVSHDLKVAYRTPDENDLNLYVYDTSHPEIEPHSIGENLYPLVWSPDGRYLAHSRLLDEPAGFHALFVWDEATTTNTTMDNIYMESNYAPFSMKWSPDGRYLAFIGFAESTDYTEALFIWDGDTVQNIMPEYLPYEVRSISMYSGNHWSPDGELIFTIHFGSREESFSSEIYLWNGETTINFSQNSERYNTVNEWNSVGQLLFYSVRGDESNYYVWNGEYTTDGFPDIESFVSIAPGLNNFEDMRWIDSNHIAAIYRNSDSEVKEVIIWNMETASIISRSTIASEKYYSQLTEGGEYVFSWQLASGLPSEYNDIETINGEIVFSIHVAHQSSYRPAWSAEGMFAYCDNPYISIWDGEESRQIAHIRGSYIQWVNNTHGFNCHAG